MAITVARMTKQELGIMISAIVEQKLLEILGDPDEDLEMKKPVRDRLLRQKKAVACGERGKRFNEVIEQFNVE